MKTKSRERDDGRRREAADGLFHYLGQQFENQHRAMKRFGIVVPITVAALRLVPILFATGPGSEIQKPLAAVVIGGLINSDVADALQNVRAG